MSAGPGRPTSGSPHGAPSGEGDLAGRLAQVPSAVGTAEAPEVIPRKRPGVALAAVLALLLSVVVVRALVVSPNIDWGVVWHYLWSDSILRGSLMTVILTAVSMLLGAFVGIIIAQMRLSGNSILAAIAQVYLFLFRGVPVIVQLVFWFNLALLFPTLALSVPFTDLVAAEADTNRLITPFIAAILGLGLAEGAYISEIFRAGILSVDKGQTEAAASLGMSPRDISRRVVLPQAMRIIVPPIGNETIAMLKNTALVVIIAASELFTRAQEIYTRTYQVVELLIVITFWYLVMTCVLTIAQAIIERRYGRGFGAQAGPLTKLWRSSA